MKGKGALKRVRNHNSAGPSDSELPLQELDQVRIRFAGDSGDGMQLTGEQFTLTSAIAGSDVSTLPDFPAEIRAPAGSLSGVSGFQLNFSSTEIHTPGDDLDALVAMNPAALKVNLADLMNDGVLLVNKDAFTDRNLEKAGYKSNPLEDGSVEKFRLFAIPLTTLCTAKLEHLEIPKKSKERSKNFFALGWRPAFDVSTEPRNRF